MNPIVNYLIEANISLILFLILYYLFLRRETKFTLMRAYLLLSIFASLTFPFVDIQLAGDASPLSISRVIPEYWLPAVVINADNSTEATPLAYRLWHLTTLIYAAGLSVCFFFLLYQLIQMSRIIRSASSYRFKNFRVAESAGDKPTFSFFNFIFIGKANELSPEEKEQIIRHESVHARQWHSLDILVVSVLKILFWFNPFINIYRKIFIQLHEFEADARAVEGGDVNKYCSLLAKVALTSADFKLANHFNKSLTVKRIEMMRTIKRKMKHWKLAAITVAMALVFLFVACQDQFNNELVDITKNSSHALIVPEKIQKRFEQVKKENPDKNFVLLELNETAMQKIDALRATYGLPSTLEIFPVDGTTVLPPITSKASLGTITFDRKTGTADSRRTFAIIEFTQQAGEISDAAAGEERVYTVVQELPEFSGGYSAMMDFIRENLRYPLDARMKGIEGTVYVSFIVETDGTITSAKSIRGISPDCDEEVRRVVSIMPPWKPGKHNGKVVRVQFVMPVEFKLQ